MRSRFTRFQRAVGAVMLGLLLGGCVDGGSGWLLGPDAAWTDGARYSVQGGASLRVWKSDGTLFTADLGSWSQAAVVKNGRAIVPQIRHRSPTMADAFGPVLAASPQARSGLPREFSTTVSDKKGNDLKISGQREDNGQPRFVRVDSKDGRTSIHMRYHWERSGSGSVLKEKVMTLQTHGRTIAEIRIGADRVDVTGAQLGSAARGTLARQAHRLAGVFDVLAVTPAYAEDEEIPCWREAATLAVAFAVVAAIVLAIYESGGTITPVVELELAAAVAAYWLAFDAWWSCMNGY